MNDWHPLYLAALAIFVARTTAIVAGSLVLGDAWRIWRGTIEKPPHSSRRNAGAWLLAAAGAIFGGSSFLLLDVGYVAPFQRLSADLCVAATWTLWAAALVQRATSRAEQPKLQYAGVAVFVLGGLALAGFTGRFG